MSWLDDIQKDLEKSRNHPVRKKKDWEIERDIRLKGQSKEASSKRKNIKESGRIGGLAGSKEDKSKAGKIGGKTAGKMNGSKNLKTAWEKNRQYMIQISSEAGKVGGKITGKLNAENGHIQEISSLGGLKASSILRTCPHCDKTIKGPLYFRYHGDKCKHKK